MQSYEIELIDERRHFLGVNLALPAGTHTVEMRFSSRPALLGLVLSALGLALLAALAALTRKRTRAPAL